MKNKPKEASCTIIIIRLSVIVKGVFYMTEKFCACFVDDPCYLRGRKTKLICKLLVCRPINEPPFQDFPVSLRIPSGDPAVNICGNFVG